VLTRPGDPDSDDPDADPSAGSGDERLPRTNPPAGDDEVVKLDATLVNIPVIVSDRTGRYIPRLKQSDFVLYEDGVRQEVAFFGDEQVPFNVVLLLDVSPSVQNNIPEIQDAALEFIRQIRPEDRVMIVSFDRGINYHTDFTNNRRTLESAIRNVQMGSGFQVNQGPGVRIPQIPNIPFPIPFPWPNRRRRGGNFTDLDQMPRQLTGNSAAASTAQRQRRRYNRDFMEDIAEAGGGPVFDAQQISDLRNLTSRIAEELRHVYVVSYYPTNSLSNGGYRAIRIRIQNQDNIAVRHRRGYNARDYSSRKGT
jgi:hypothetical protein